MTNRSFWLHMLITCWIPILFFLNSPPSYVKIVQLANVWSLNFLHQLQLFVPPVMDFLCDFSINPIDPDEAPEIDFAGDE